MKTGKKLLSQPHLEYITNIIKFIPDSVYEISDKTDENVNLNETYCLEDVNSDWFQWSCSIYDAAQ